MCADKAILYQIILATFVKDLVLAVTPGKRPRPVPVTRSREMRAEIRQKKYRYLYQIRTARGDVISQVMNGNRAETGSLDADNISTGNNLEGRTHLPVDHTLTFESDLGNYDSPVTGTSQIGINLKV